MKHIVLSIITVILSMGFVSCIEDYELPSTETESMVVIFGQIAGNSECVFSLRTTASSDYKFEKDRFVENAKVAVKGTDGQVFEGHESGSRLGTYIVHVGSLNADAKYYLSVSTKYGDFESEPMKPLSAPKITEIFYEQPRPDKKVDVLISTEDPRSPCYVMWDIDEYYEIYTPYVALWECTKRYMIVHSKDDMYIIPTNNDSTKYTPTCVNKKIPAGRRTNHGWRHNVGRSGFASNENYGYGAIKGLCVNQIANTDPRLQTRYYARIKLTGISKEEYEYRRLLNKLTNDVGGMFSYMPSELPSNIKSLGKTKGLGFIGVHGNGNTMGLYINGDDIGYKSVLKPRVLNADEFYEHELMRFNGYRLMDIDPKTEEEMWTYDWCVDYRMGNWGGEPLAGKPEFWEDK